MFDKEVNKDYQKIIDAIGIGNPRTLIHVQIPGQMHPLHIDLAYGGGKWDYLGDDKENKTGNNIQQASKRFSSAIIQGRNYQRC